MTILSNGDPEMESVQVQPSHEAVSAIEYLNRAKDRLPLLDVPEVLTLLILNIVQYPEKVQVHLTRSLRTLVIEYDMHPSDRGKVIGRNGHTIMSLRSLMRTVAGASSLEYKISVVEGERPGRKSRRVR